MVTQMFLNSLQFTTQLFEVGTNLHVTSILFNYIV